MLSRLRDFSWPTVQWQPTDREKGCIHRVWVFVGVRLKKYDKNWDFVGAGLPKSEKLALRAGVRERLLTVFDEAAFSEDADEANGVLDNFKRQHLLDWGNRLLAQAANADCCEFSHGSAAAVLNAGDSESYSRAANELGAVNAAWERGHAVGGAQPI